ncbi:MAG: hypothetical protein F6K08_00935 [Okeania sp. SIO1H6]|nr:hypothetical protein [Okeania sp. SIO1H6]
MPLTTSRQLFRAFSQGGSSGIRQVEKTKTFWVTTFTTSTSRLQGERTFAIVMNASSVEEATEIDYFITNVELSKVTSE